MSEMLLPTAMQLGGEGNICNVDRSFQMQLDRLLQLNEKRSAQLNADEPFPKLVGLSNDIMTE